MLGLGFIISISSASWGTKLLHDSYTLGRISTHMLKSGSKEITVEASEFHSLQSSKELAVHLGLVILGVSFISFIVTRRLST